MDPGSLDRRVTIEAKPTGLNSYGEADETGAWVNVASDVAAGKRDMGGREFAAGAGEQAEGVTVWTLRWRTDLSEGMRIVHDGAAYEVTNIKELGRRAGLEVLTKARVP